jgi:hypothetical protein
LKKVLFLLTVSRHFEQSIDRLLDSYSRAADDATATYRTKLESIDKLISRYDNRLASAFGVAWLTFPQLLSNASAFKSRVWSQSTVFTGSFRSLPATTGADPSMARLLEIEEREIVMRWSQLFWQRCDEIRIVRKPDFNEILLNFQRIFLVKSASVVININCFVKLTTKHDALHQAYVYLLTYLLAGGTIKLFHQLQPAM